MPHDHHRYECAHERVKFCKTCNVTHCLDCKVEWVAPCTLPHSWYQGYYGISGATTGSLAIQSSGQSIDLTPTITYATGHNH